MHPDAIGKKHRLVAALAYPDAEALDITGPLDVFSIANRVDPYCRNARVDKPRAVARYETQLIGQSLDPVRVTAGIRMVPDISLAAGPGPDLDQIDTLIIPGGLDIRAAFDAKTLAWLRDAATRVRRLVGVCSGAVILAEAGLLKDRRATTHWESCPRLATYPDVSVEADAIFVRDGHIYTSAGITAGMDLALSLVEADWGSSLALAVARELVMYARRSGGQSQFSQQLLAQCTESSGFGTLVDWCLTHLHDDLSVGALAQRSAMSVRNFARAFVRDFGITPAKFVEAARVEAARDQLETTDRSLDSIAAHCGFKRSETMSRSFRRQLGVLPADYRKHFRVRSA